MLDFCAVTDARVRVASDAAGGLSDITRWMLMDPNPTPEKRQRTLKDADHLLRAICDALGYAAPIKNKEAA